MWRVPALSDADPEGFRKWFAPQLAALEAEGVRIAAFELGNEFNTTGYNADLPAPGSGRVLGLSDLDNPNDPEARNVANGYRAHSLMPPSLPNSSIRQIQMSAARGAGNGVGLAKRLTILVINCAATLS